MIQNEQFGRYCIYLQTVGAFVFYVLAVALMDLLYVRHYIHDAGMAFGYAFVLVEAWIIVILLVCSVIIKLVRHRKDVRWSRAQPVLLLKLSAHLSGSDTLAELSSLQRRYPHETERAIVELLSRVQGSARVRLSELAVALGLAERWKAGYRSYAAARRRLGIANLALLEHDTRTATLVLALADSDDEVKLEASRALIETHKVAEMTAAFQIALTDSLLVRAVLTEALRPHSLLLCKEAVPAALASANAKTVRTALEIVRAWGQSAALTAVGPLLHHEDCGVRAAALAILPQLADSDQFEPEVLRLLADGEEIVRTAAAETAGRMRWTSAVPYLNQCLKGGGAEATVAAAYALARIGAAGWDALDSQVHGARSAAACASLEALEQTRSERLAMAGA